MNLLNRLFGKADIGYFCDITLYAPDGSEKGKQTLFIEHGSVFNVGAASGESMIFKFTRA